MRLRTSSQVTVSLSMIMEPRITKSWLNGFRVIPVADGDEWILDDDE